VHGAPKRWCARNGRRTAIDARGATARSRRRSPDRKASPNGGEKGGAVSGTTVVLLAILAAAVALVVLNRLEFLSVFPRRRRRPRPGGDGPEGGPPAA